MTPQVPEPKWSRGDEQARWSQDAGRLRPGWWKRGGGARGKAENDEAEGVVGRSAAEGTDTCGAEKAKTEQGRAGGTRQPGGAILTTAPGGAEGRKSQAGADWSTD